jgi:hypothetical protein
MLCEHCLKCEATVHLHGWQLLPRPSSVHSERSAIEHHYCESCAQVLGQQGNPLLNPRAAAGSSAQPFKVKVIRVLAEQLEVEVISEERPETPKQLTFLRSRFPEDYSRAGMEFNMFVSEVQLRHFAGGD